MNHNAQKALRLPCSESIILDHGQGFDEEETVRDPQQISMVTLSRLLLKDVKDLGRCKSLRICILSDNFITKIDALIECVHLVKLDLKGNQITQLPGASFWERLRELQLLNLHDNNMLTRENIEGLGGCQKLTGLTLYDTPLSLKGNYRQCIVNSILSLKALDHNVISDEEIIDNWHLPLKFKALNPNFFVNLYPPSTSLRSYPSEMRSVQEAISEINRIQAIYSPTLIIQRWIRGHLKRKSLGLVKAVPRCEKRRLCVTPVSPVEPKAEDTTKSRQTQEDSWVKECLIEKEVQVPLLKADPRSNMLMSRRQESQDIRRAIQHFHSQQPKPPRPVCHRQPYRPIRNAEMRLMDRSQGSVDASRMSQRANRLQAKAEVMRKKTELVNQTLVWRQGVKMQRHNFMENRREEVLWEREKERAQMEPALTRLRASRDREVQDARQRHGAFLEEKKKVASEWELMTAFSGQHAALTKAFNKNSTGQRLLSVRREKSERVASCKMQAK
ncbi:uncharacterized protein lrriq3 [Centroberyx gerrardi]